jgi:predicted ATP-binding protein involved in virulence
MGTTSEHKALDAALLQIDRLELRNFRCFSECNIDLHASLTVLVAENAQGKTAILDAVALALEPIVAAIGGKSSPGFSPSAVHLSMGPGNTMTPVLPMSFRAEALIAGQPVSWGRSMGTISSHSRSSTKGLKEIAGAVEQLARAAADATTVTLPVVAYYRTDRLWTSQNESGRSKTSERSIGRLVGYDEWSTPTSSFWTFVEWYRTAFAALSSSTSKFLDHDNRIELQIASIHQAVDIAMEPTGWTSIAWEGRASETGFQPIAGEYISIMNATKGRLPLQFLSDGIKNMVSLVADLAYRCVRLNPHLGLDAAQQTAGVVMIDEIDMHLHPRWQQVVVELFKKAFPKVQLIVTTHSPQVLSTVDYESIRLIRLDGSKASVRTPRFQTRGIESADILARLMDVDPVPQVDEASWLSDYRALVQSGQYETADGERLWLRIINHFGADNPVLMEIDTLRRFQEFRQSHGISGNAEAGDAKD